MVPEPVPNYNYSLLLLIWEAMLACGMCRLPDATMNAAMPFVREEGSLS